MKEMRPTTGKVVLALFNILGSLRENSFLDLFSGSGQIAIEAFKKVASPVYSVESERKRAAEIFLRLRRLIETERLASSGNRFSCGRNQSF